MDKPLILSDLDDSLFNTKRKLKGNAVKVASVDIEGKASGLMNAKQVSFFNMIAKAGVLIPVTARSSRNVKQLKIEASSFMIVSHGAVILDSQGNYNEEFQLFIEHELNKNVQRMKEMNENLTELLKKTFIKDLFKESGIRFRPAIEYDREIVFTFKVVDNKFESLLSKFREVINERVDMKGFYFHQNGNNLAILPTFIAKEIAVKFLIDKFFDNERLILTIGDSLTDLGYMGIGDFMIIPKNTQLTNEVISQGEYECQI